MATLHEGNRTAEFIVREANGYRSREKGVVTAGTKYEPGTLLGQITATGKYVRHASGAADGSQTVAGILYEGIEAGDEEERTIVVRDAEVHAGYLTYEDGADASAITAANSGLADLGLIVR